jgi:hypothetical protein
LLIAPFELLIASIRETLFNDNITSASDFLFV